MGEIEFGFSPASRVALLRQLQRSPLPRSPFADLRGKRGAQWVLPRLVAEITFQEWMEGSLRHPSFRGIAAEKRPDDCLLTDTSLARW